MSGWRQQRVVVDRELGVERAHLAVRRDDQRVDLDEHRVGLAERAVGRLDDRHDLLALVRGDARAEAELARDPGMPAGQRVDVQAGERVGVVLGHLLDIDAAARREHEAAGAWRRGRT